MSNKILLFGLCFAIIFVLSDSASTKFTTDHDDVDVDAILANDKLIDMYFKCIMDEGKCPPEAKEFKKLLPEAIKTKCEPCSEKQKEGANKVVKYLYEKKPEMWKRLEDKYDPDHTYRTLYKEEAQKLGYNV